MIRLRKVKLQEYVQMQDIGREEIELINFMWVLFGFHKQVLVSHLFLTKRMLCSAPSIHGLLLRSHKELSQ